ncbi:uncharacterized protein TRIADDRAFT_58348 [Trichoplax adhaerens]|uniref:Major facilitator superfamily associated domain-containing protein n=1 Tax=Trichoplax adhaerens TaxID=10228 RepID=B3S1V1_TRIAD|nr:hypothetical protein TRIADDRAFT_58348 [Trichoplax adhaerens]EDV23569.1 hypothetical protein TRIADDRAFT_58348 [Trichoplax adhaerens]|eukprot:XP_002114479.1 hypothetical protein TRIADDRAFT_58348 [Trichoplax adhaerens]
MEETATELPAVTAADNNNYKQSKYNLLLTIRKYPFVNILIVIFLVIFSIGTVNELSDSYPYFYPLLRIAPNASVFQTIVRPANSCLPYRHLNNTPTKVPSPTGSTPPKPLPPIIWISIINLSSYLPGLILSVVYSVWSDLYQNRKIFLVLCITGFLFQAVGSVLTVATTASPAAIIPGNVISGLFGNYPTFLFSCYAYVVDIDLKISRTTRFVIIQFVIFVAEAITATTSERWAKYYGFKPPLIFAVVLLALAVIYTVIFLQAHLVVATKNYEIKRAKDHIPDLWRNFPKFFKTIYKPGEDASRKYYYALLVIFFFTMFPTTGFAEIINIYLAGYPLCWNLDQILEYDTYRAASFAIGGIVVWLAFKKILSEMSIAGIGMTFFTVQIGILSMATHNPTVYGTIAVGAVGGVTFPCIYGQLSSVVSNENQGLER